jgi:thioredoxin reductase
VTTHSNGRLDVVIAGAGAAGLSAALILGRARRRVLVLDGGPPRNAPAAAAHGLFTRDDTPPVELLQIAREQLAPYPSITLRRDEAVSASAVDGGFTVTLASGEVAGTRQILLATGVIDDLPDIPGVAERWGTGVHHCPYCHGWELRDEHIAIHAPGGEGFPELRVTLLRGWSPHLTVLTDGPAALDQAARARIEALGSQIDERCIEAYGDSPAGAHVVRFTDGTELAVAGLFVAPPQRHRSDLAAPLGCEISTNSPSPMPFVAVDATSGQTTVPGVFAAGDITGPAQSVILAAAGGARAAYFMNHALAAADAAEVLARAGVPAPPGAR